MAKVKSERTTIKCVECGNTFSITKEEQDWYKEMGFALPKRCSKCRKARRHERNEREKNSRE